MNKTLTAAWQSKFMARLRKRLAPFLDLSFWVLTVLSLAPLFLLDRAMVQTLLQWCAFFLALSGMSLVICRVFLPQVDLSEWLQKVWEEPDNKGAGLVVLAVCVLLGMTLLSMVLWAKA